MSLSTGSRGCGSRCTPTQPQERPAGSSTSTTGRHRHRLASLHPESRPLHSRSARTSRSACSSAQDPRMSRAQCKPPVASIIQEHHLSFAHLRRIILTALTSQEADDMGMLGQRVKALRERHHLRQDGLARKVGTSPSQISLIESGKSQPSLKTAVAIARALNTSLDFLTGAAPDERRVARILYELRQKTALMVDMQAEVQQKMGEPWTDFVGIPQIDAAAGAGIIDREERVVGRFKFPALWLRREGLRAESCQIVQVVGESMEPTLPDGCLILVNRRNRDLEDGRVFLIRTGDELIVKRALEHETEGWLLTSDNPDKKAWPTVPWPEDGRPVGEVRWASYSLP